MTKPTDTAESTNETHCMVLRRLKAGSYSAEFNGLIGHWLDWHHYPINVEDYATVFDSRKIAKKYIFIANYRSGKNNITTSYDRL